MLSRFKIPAACLVAALLLTGCASATSQKAAETQKPAKVATAFPRTVQVPAGDNSAASSVKISAEPQKIAALDYESAEVLAELGLAARLVLVPAAVQNPVLGSHVTEMVKVPNTIPVAMELNVETVLDLQPDLVVLSPRHGAENKIAAVLQQSGVPTLLLPKPWSSVKDMLQNISLIGEAVGADSNATKLHKTLQKGLQSAKSKSTSTPKPRVLILSNQAGRPFITAGKSLPVELVEKAGAINVSDEIGVKITGPITAEQIVQAKPDAILLIDMNGSGERLFKELLQNSAVQTLPGASNTMLITGKEVQALGLSNTISGLQKLQSWLAKSA